jgi:H+-transporting ATPase
MTAYTGDEYESLLEYVQDEAAKAQAKRAQAEDEGDEKWTRPWYAPWKKVKVESDTEKKVSGRSSISSVQS